MSATQDRSQLPLILLSIPSGKTIAPEKGKKWTLTNVLRVDHETGTDSILFYRSIPLTLIDGAIATSVFQNIGHLSALAQAPTNMAGLEAVYPHYLQFAGGANAKAYLCVIETDDIETAIQETKPTYGPSLFQRIKGGWSF